MRPATPRFPEHTTQNGIISLQEVQLTTGYVEARDVTMLPINAIKVRLL
jgi:hypothetical protein